jgi:Zn-dependent protease with chaperone function/tetratricopeptide (TPR) repeat protein
MTLRRANGGLRAILLGSILIGQLLSGGVYPVAAQYIEEQPPLDRTKAVRLPDDFALGLEAALAFSRHFGLVEDEEMIRRVNDVGYTVALAAGHPEIAFTFQILDVDEPNALALPGGWIFLTRGILEVDLTDAELAHLLGHEISHVTKSHFSRQGRLNGLLSLLQTAAVVAVAIAGSNDSPSGPVIHEPGSYRYPQSSAEAALTGTAIFGSVFHELLLRGYSRKLEFEADDGGRDLAARAGYPREAGASLLEKLHLRIYEDREFGYWRTHPYFTDRVRIARAAGKGRDYNASRDEVIAYRNQIQATLARAATAFRSQAVADYLYTLALRAGPSTASNVRLQADLLGFRLGRIERESPILRPYGPIRVEFDSLLARGSRADSDPRLLEQLRRQRDAVEQQRLDLLPRYADALGGANTNTQVLEAFLLNFPDDPRADTLRLQLARAYRLSGRYDLAAEKLCDMIERSIPDVAAPDSTEFDRARAELLRTLPFVEDPEVCQSLYDRLGDPEIREASLERLETIADSLGMLEQVGRFVQTYPASPAVDRFRSRMNALAETELKKGRLHEGLGDLQSALQAFNRIAILAPGTRWAGEARNGITRIQALAAAGPEP